MSVILKALGSLAIIDPVIALRNIDLMRSSNLPFPVTFWEGVDKIEKWCIIELH